MGDKWLQELEYRLLDNGHYDRYCSLVRENHLCEGCNHSLDNLQYALALSTSFSEHGGNDSYLFVGGIGVLGNLLSHVDESYILNFRPIHDLDIVIKSRTFEGILPWFFDNPQDWAKSLSIPGKMVCKGYAYDSEGNRLNDGNIDIYVPYKKQDDGAKVHNIKFSGDQWDAKKKVELFGIPVNVANPLTMLLMKLDIPNTHNEKKRRNGRKDKDVVDITSLLGVLERESYTPETVYSCLSDLRYERLKNYITNLIDDNHSNNELIGPSQSYLEELTKLEEVENEDLVSVGYTQ